MLLQAATLTQGIQDIAGSSAHHNHTNMEMFSSQGHFRQMMNFIVMIYFLQVLEANLLFSCYRQMYKNMTWLLCSDN